MTPDETTTASLRAPVTIACDDVVHGDPCDRAAAVACGDPSDRAPARVACEPAAGAADASRRPSTGALSLDQCLPAPIASFLFADTREASRVVVPVSPLSSEPEMFAPDAVLVPMPGFLDRLVSLTPIEMRVLAFVDGRRPLARIAMKAGIALDDLERAVALLEDKGAVMLGGVVQKSVDDVRRLAKELEGELDRDTEEWLPTVRPAAEPRGNGARGAVVVVAAPGRGARAIRG